MNDPRKRLAFAALAAMTPAVLGAMGLARLLVWREHSFSGGTFLLGLVCGVVVLFVARSRAWSVVGTSAVVGAIAVALTYLFNAKWNTTSRFAAQLELTHHLEPSAARMQAETMFGNASLWELLRANWHPLWLVAGLAGALGAGLTIKSHLIGKLLRIPPQ